MTVSPSPRRPEGEDPDLVVFVVPRYLSRTVAEFLIGHGLTVGEAPPDSVPTAEHDVSLAVPDPGMADQFARVAQRFTNINSGSFGRLARFVENLPPERDTTEQHDFLHRNPPYFPSEHEALRAGLPLHSSDADRFVAVASPWDCAVCPSMEIRMHPEVLEAGVPFPPGNPTPAHRHVTADTSPQSGCDYGTHHAHGFLVVDEGVTHLTVCSGQ